MPTPPHNALRLNPAKLLHSKWTALTPVNREKHFIVTALITPPYPDAAIDLITLEAVLTRRSFNLHWRELNDEDVWQQGWR
ncbi:TIGR02450 family Trp-rich protein [Duganella qianjiadongensis]|uniref:TIGR02450 family Trp-rich protein n=1 Tax=Duganella qianjiadongensis TaxID=2692176 RepID=A0ABW9VE78_9BURK|nr:TIGR02450 family Trp-rich protein [Duganella qianjiadongensis]MYM37924.1 TIGR02450 family Trp-rich protein [Duganella qianjiadongensis]